MNFNVRKWFNRLLLIAVIVGTGADAWAQQTSAFTAQQAVDYALKNTVQVKNALLSVQSQA